MFKDAEYIDDSKFFGYCSNTCPVNYTEPCGCGDQGCSPKHPKPRFYKEFHKDRIIPPAKLSVRRCGTTNTTTYFQGSAGAVDQFTLINPPNCSFPFNYKGKWYNKCIARDDPFCRKVLSLQSELSTLMSTRTVPRICYASNLMPEGRL